MGMLKNLIELIKDMLDPDLYMEGMCGVPGLHTSVGDPFYECCKTHDAGYDVVKPGQSTKEIDDELLQCCLAVAETYPSIYDKPSPSSSPSSSPSCGLLIESEYTEEFIECLSTIKYDEIDHLYNDYLKQVWHTREVLTLRAKIYYRLARRYGIVREWLGKMGLWQFGKMIINRMYDKNESN